MSNEIKFRRMNGLDVSVFDDSNHEKLIDGRVRYLLSGETKKLGGNEGWYVGLRQIPLGSLKRIDIWKGEVYVSSEFAEDIRRKQQNRLVGVIH